MKLPKKIRIHVTKEDIRLGKPGSSTSCPVARAINRSLKSKKCYAAAGFMEADVFSGLRVPRIRTEHHVGVIDLPNVARAFIEAFDTNNGRVPTPKPFSCTLRITPV